MKKIFLLILATTTLVFTSCNKKWDNTIGASQVQEVSFRGLETSIDNLKSTCDNPEAQYAIVKIVLEGTNDTTTYYPEVFYLGGVAYTQSIKLPVGSYKLTVFQMMNDNNTPGMANDGDDILVLAAPNQGSSYGNYSSTPLPKPFTVTDFNKNEIEIQVICFEEVDYSAFGFTWFKVDQVNIRKQVFFGDLCVKDPSAYVGSNYANQSNGVQIDMPAIFKIEVYKGGSLVNTFTNDMMDFDGLGLGHNYGEGAPLEITYVDLPNVTDNFEFKLLILVKNGSTFTYKHFHTWSFSDDEKIDTNGDGVVDFILGNCNIEDADLILPPYMNLPSTATYKIVGWAGTANLGAYADAELSNITDSGYDEPIANGTLPSWCADKSTSIIVGEAYNMDVYSSLYPELIPLFTRDPNFVTFSEHTWPMVNWLMNHLDYYPTAEMQDIQDAIWILLNNYSEGSTLAETIAAQASTYGVDYVPLPGGWAAVIFVPAGTPLDQAEADIQTMFIRVDP